MDLKECENLCADGIIIKLYFYNFFSSDFVTVSEKWTFKLDILGSHGFLLKKCGLLN